MNIAEEDYDLDMPDGSGTSSRLVFKLLHPRIVKCYHALASSSVIVITSTSKIIYLIAINNFLDQNCFHSTRSFNEKPHHMRNFRYCYEYNKISSAVLTQLAL